MISETNKLTAYTIKLSNKDRQAMKLICALDHELKYQYSLFDEAVSWADNNKEKLMAIASPKEGHTNTYYLSDSVELLIGLVKEWNCTPTRALYTAVIQFLKYREKEIKAKNLNQANLVENF